MSINQSYERITGQADDVHASLSQQRYAASPSPDAAGSAPASPAPNADAGAVPETETASESPAGAGRVIIVGDSRTVGMQRCAPRFGDPCIYIAASGEGYLWFESSGIHRLRRTLKRYEGAPVVFNLGVNDTASINRYISIYRELIEEYPSSSFWFLSVNPVTEDSLLVPDSNVQEFNRLMRSAFPDQYLDSYTWLKKNGFESIDGVHYSEETYQEIHDFVTEAVLGKPAAAD